MPWQIRGVVGVGVEAGVMEEVGAAGVEGKAEVVLEGTNQVGLQNGAPEVCRR